MRTRLAFLAFLLATAAHAQAPSPAQIGVSPTPPQSLFWLDTTKTWRALPTPGSPAGAKCDGTTDDAPKLQAMFNANTTSYIPACSQPYFLSTDVLPNNPTGKVTIDPMAIFSGPGAIKFGQGPIYPYSAKVFSNDEMNATIGAGWLTGTNYFLTSRRVVNNGAVNVPVVGIYTEGSDNLGTAAGGVGAWGLNTVGSVQAGVINGLAWSLEADVVNFEPTASVYGVDVRASGNAISTIAFRAAVGSASGFKQGLTFINAPNCMFCKYGLGRAIYISGNGGDIWKGLDFSEPNFTNGAVLLPASTTSGNGIWFGTDVQLYRSGANFLKISPNLSITGSLDVAGVTVINGIKVSGLPTSAGGGGLTVCVDSTGLFYKKATCP